MPVSESDCHRLLLSVGASALLHAGLLTTVVTDPRLHLDVVSRPVQAVVNLPGRDMPVPVPVAAATRVSPSPAPRQPSGRRLGAQTAVRGPVSGATVGAPATIAKPGRSPASESEAMPAAAVATATASAVAGEPVNADDLRQYRIALAIAARRFKRYPPVARERGWQGRVEVALSLSAWQRVPQLSLIRSSGHALLDEQALAMTEQAAANTLLPESLKGRDFRVLLPIDFSLDDAR